MRKNHQTLEGAMLLPGVMYDGGADLSAPLLSLKSLQSMIEMYDFEELGRVMPHMNEFGRCASQYGIIDTTLKHLYAPVTLFYRHKKCILSEMLTVMVMKYGWFGIPDDLLVRTEQYLVAYSDVLPDVSQEGYRHERDLEHSTHVRMLKINKHTGKNIWEHLRYIAAVMYHKMQKQSKMTVKQMLEQDSRNNKYVDIVAEFVKVSLLLSKCNVKVPIGQSFVDSSLFKAALALMPSYVIGPNMIYKSPIATLEKTWECKLPTINQEDVKALKPHTIDDRTMCLLTMNPIIQPTFAATPVVGVNPRLMDFNEQFNTDTDKEGNIWSHMWYIGGILTWPGIENDGKTREYVAKMLCSLWRMDKVHAGDTLRLFGHIAHAFKLNTDDILSTYYRLSMSNIAWAYMRMPTMVEFGLSIGPRIENVTSKAIIRKTQTGVSTCIHQIAKMMMEGVTKQEDEDEES
jgi:hypothetical protein